MATIVKTPAGSWKAVVRRQGWPTSAKTFRTKRDAEDWARRTEDEMVRGVYIRRTEVERMTLGEALNRYLQEVSPSKRSEKSDTHNAKPLRTVLGRYSLAALTPKLIAEYRDQRLATVSKRTGRPLSPSTVRLELALLGHLYTIAIKEWGMALPANPVRLIRRPPAPPGRNRRLTWSEARRLLKACDRHSNPMLAWVVRVALYTGMRQGEITSLRMDQVDIDRGIVRLNQTKNGSARTVPLSRRARRILAEAIANPARAKDSDLVFPGEPGRDGTGVRRPYTVGKLWAVAVKRAGIDGLRFHDLRHEAVSRLVERGLTDQEVAAISGHKSMQMLRRYTHLRAEDLVAKLG